MIPKLPNNLETLLAAYRVSAINLNFAQSGISDSKNYEDADLALRTELIKLIGTNDIIPVPQLETEFADLPFFQPGNIEIWFAQEPIYNVFRSRVVGAKDFMFPGRYEYLTQSHTKLGTIRGTHSDNSSITSISRIYSAFVTWCDSNDVQYFKVEAFCNQLGLSHVNMTEGDIIIRKIKSTYFAYAVSHYGIVEIFKEQFGEE